MTDERLGELLGIAGKGAVAMIRAAVEQLNAQYDQTGRSFRAERLAGGWQLLTRPAFAPLLARLHRQRQESRLSPAALETLAIIAYRQPMSRVDVEEIRGVGSTTVLHTLQEWEMIDVVGRGEGLGRPLLYGTTRRMLDHFGLRDLADLPRLEDLPVTLQVERTLEVPLEAPAEAEELAEAEAPADAHEPATA